ncbi:hypothetical protein FI667_g15353, partial [Globisporangium splendens]
MENRVALRQGPPHESALHSGHEPEESEDEKVYYGFGVFMGLPLADLKAMKEDFMQKQTASDDFRSASVGSRSTSSSTMSGRSIEYDNASRGGEYVSRGGIPSVVPPVEFQNARVRPIAGQQRPGPAPGGYGGGAPVMGGRGIMGREYDASHGDEDGAQSDEGSDGSYSQPKSHSLNFILH